MSFQAMAWADEPSANLESPIEGMALLAMRESMSASVAASLAEAEEMDSPLPIIIPQLKVERYRLDFGILAGRCGRCRIFALECDGREFHLDKVKDSRRSIFLWGCGVKVYRATGSEIYRDAIAAVAPIVRDVTRHHWGEQ